MASAFDLFNWYWDVLDTNSGTQVYSTKAERYVPVSDPDYVAWLSAHGGNTPYVIDTNASLASNMNVHARNYYVPRVQPGIIITTDQVLTNPPFSFVSYVNTTAGVLNITLPSALSPKTIPIGTKFTIACDSTSTSAIQVRRDDLTVIAIISPRMSLTFYLLNNLTPNGQWGHYIEGSVGIVGTINANDFAQWADATRLVSVSPAATLTAIGGQPLDADLTALAALTGVNVIYYRSAANTWSPVTIGTGLSFSGGTLDTAALSTFRATLSANQTGVAQNTFTKVTFDTAPVNVGNHFNTTNNRWTPPAGRVMVGVALTVTSGTNANSYAVIYKNGAAIAYAYINTGSGSTITTQIQYLDIANGTDHYEAWVLHNFAGTATVNANTSESRFWGMRL